MTIFFITWRHDISEVNSYKSNQLRNLILDCVVALKSEEVVLA